MILDPLPFLAAAQSAEGGWGYQPQQDPLVEPTGAILLALSNYSQEEAVFQKAFSWLLDIQHQDGGWGMNRADSQSAWMTAWAVWALAKTSRAGPQASAGAQWLLQAPVLQISNLDDLAVGKKVAGIDFSLRGWPWQPDEASWVEPTSLAVLALAALESGYTERLGEAGRYLINRRCPGGGWNVGNPIMFGSFLPARAQPTALSLMALSRLAPAAILDEDFATLQNDALQDDGALALGWGGLALAVYGRPSEVILTRLAGKQRANGSWEDNPYATAIAWLAYQGVSP